MGHIWKNRSHSEKWVTLGTLGHTWKNGSNWKKKESHLKSHLEQWVTLGKKAKPGEMGHTWKNGSHLGKWVIFGKMDHT